MCGSNFKSRRSLCIIGSVLFVCTFQIVCETKHNPWSQIVNTRLLLLLMMMIFRFHGISTLVGYLMPKPSLSKNNSVTGVRTCLLRFHVSHNTLGTPPSVPSWLIRNFFQISALTYFPPQKHFLNFLSLSSPFPVKRLPALIVS